MALRLAVLASGGGSTLQNLLDQCASGRLDAEVTLVIVSNPNAHALVRATNAGVPHHVVAPRPAKEAGEKVFSLCRMQTIDLVVLAGYMHLLPIPADYENRVMNVHPSLIPAFCGKGCYGKKVHAAVLERGVKVTGCTVHFVDNEYDHGPIILQQVTEVLDDDDADSLAARVQTTECEAYPLAIRLFGEKRLVVKDRRVSLLTNPAKGKTK